MHMFITLRIKVNKFCYDMRKCRKSAAHTLERRELEITIQTRKKVHVLRFLRNPEDRIIWIKSSN